MGKIETNQGSGPATSSEYYAGLVDLGVIKDVTLAGIMGKIGGLCEDAMVPLCELRIRQEKGEIISTVDKSNSIGWKSEVNSWRTLLASYEQEQLIMEAEERARQRAEENLNGV